MQSHSSVINGACTENGAPSVLKDVPCASKNSVTVSNGDVLGTELKRQSSIADKLSKTDKEVVRLIGQHLCSLGLQKSCDALMTESGCHLEHAAATNFRKHIMHGHWQEIDAVLHEMKPHVKHPRHLHKMKFLVMEQQFLELLEEGRVIEALHCLRSRITPLRIFVARVHELSSFLMISNPQELCKAANWDGKGPKSRTKLLDKLLGYLPISVMMKPHRLTTLLTQAMQHQQNRCLFHNSSSTLSLSSSSLLTDHTCLRRNFPTVTKQVLNDHYDEVRFCQFSHKGDMLATGCKESSVFIWDVDPVTQRLSHVRTLVGGQSYGIGYLAWSPTDTHIMACGSEDASELWLWNAQTGELCSKLFQSEEDSLTCCSWMPDGKRFVAAGSKGQFYQCELDGNIIESWEGVRVRAVACLPDNNTVLAADTQLRIRAYNFDDMTDYNVIKEDHPIMSFSLSQDGRLILLNVATQGVHLWDVEDRILIRKYRGVVHGFFVIYSSFGGTSDEYIASGSEDHKVYIWHRSREKAIETLSGHSKTVNCVSWNSATPSMLASVSDDGTVRIWGPKDNSSSDSDSDDDFYHQSGDY